MQAIPSRSKSQARKSAFQHRLAGAARTRTPDRNFFRSFRPDALRANLEFIMFKRRRDWAAVRGSPERRTYHSWKNLKNRCDNRRDAKYRHYGERGITYDPKWALFAGFVADMGLAPPGMSLDRIDNDGPYCRTNCRWATPKQQSRNRRFNRIIEFNGERKPLAAWAEQLGINCVTLRGRLDSGWPLERALSAGRFDSTGKFTPNRNATTEPRVREGAYRQQRRLSISASQPLDSAPIPTLTRSSAAATVKGTRGQPTN
jgi:hypothetical protein